MKIIDIFPHFNKTYDDITVTDGGSVFSDLATYCTSYNATVNATDVEKKTITLPIRSEVGFAINNGTIVVEAQENVSLGYSTQKIRMSMIGLFLNHDNTIRYYTANKFEPDEAVTLFRNGDQITNEHVNKVLVTDNVDHSTVPSTANAEAYYCVAEDDYGNLSIGYTNTECHIQSYIIDETKINTTLTAPGFTGKLYYGDNSRIAKDLPLRLITSGTKITSDMLNGIIVCDRTDHSSGNVSLNFASVLGSELPFSRLFKTYGDYNKLDKLFIAKFKNKEVSSYVQTMLSIQDGQHNTLTKNTRLEIIEMIYKRYYRKWNELWLNYVLENEREFNPIFNYDRYEKMGGKDTNTTTPDNFKTISSADASDNGSTTDSKIYGFNSSTGVNDASQTTSNKSKVVTEQQGKMVNEIAYGADNHIYGNIGVVESTTMLERFNEYISTIYLDTVSNDIIKEYSISMTVCGDYEEESSSSTSSGGTVTSVSVRMNGETKGTVTTAGTIDLGTVLTEHQSLNGYATKTWVEDKGYLTEHQSLAAYRTSASQDIIDAAQNTDIANKISDVKLNNTSIVDANKVANVPIATTNTLGVVMVNQGYGAIVKNDGSFYADNLTYSGFNGKSVFHFMSKGTLENVANARGWCTAIKTTMDNVAVANAQYYLGEQTTLTISMPTNATVGQSIVVVFSSGATACTLTCDLQGFDFVPKANKTNKIVFTFIGSDKWTVEVEES